MRREEHARFEGKSPGQSSLFSRSVYILPTGFGRPIAMLFARLPSGLLPPSD